MLGFRDQDVDRNQCFKIQLVRGHSVFVLGVFLMHRDAHICFVVTGVPGALGLHIPDLARGLTPPALVRTSPRSRVCGSMRHWCHRQLQQPYVGHPTFHDSSQLSAMDVGAGSVCVIISEKHSRIEAPKLREAVSPCAAFPRF